MITNKYNKNAEENYHARNLSLSFYELLIINNSLNEILNGIKVSDDFFSSHNITIEQSEKLFNKISFEFGKLQKQNKDKTEEEKDIVNATIPINPIELLIINNSVKEVLKQIEEWEYCTRIGGEREEAEDLLNKINIK